MAFFDDLNKRLSNAGQSAVQSAQNFANVQKLNSAISEEEKKVSNLYTQIGKAYYELNAMHPEEPYMDFVTAITDAINSINTYKEQVKQIKGVTNCPNCGAEVPYSSQFCNSCGTRIPVRTAQTVAPAGSIQCTACGAFVPSGYKFCTSCGNVMGVPVDSEENETPISASENKTKKCPNCGKELVGEAIFCTNCGQQM